MKRKGIVVRRVSEGSVEQRCEPTNRNRIEGVKVQTSQLLMTKSISIKGLSVDPAVVHRKCWGLPREVCTVVPLPPQEGGDVYKASYSGYV